MELSQPHPGGRPTKYDPSFVEEVDRYIEETYNQEKMMPTIEGFAIRIGVDPLTLERWADKKYKQGDPKVDPKLWGKLKLPEFCSALKRIKYFQKNKLIADGLYNKNCNSVFCMFLLKCNHGMIEPNQLDLTTKGKELPVPLLGGSVVPKNDSTQ